MTDIDIISEKIERLTRQNTELEERIADLELQVANLTERLLRTSCASCGMH